MDITVRYSGLLMGVGNTFASAMTYVTPLAGAHLMAATRGDWRLLFASLAALNGVGRAPRARKG